MPILISKSGHQTTFVRAPLRSAQEETFGPVSAVMRFSSEDKAIRLANDTGMAWRPILTLATSIACGEFPSSWKLGSSV